MSPLSIESKRTKEGEKKMKSEIILDKDVFNPDNLKFLNSDEFSVLLYILSEERMFSPTIELHLQKIVEKGLLLKYTNKSKEKAKVIINKLSNKNLISLVGQNDEYYVFAKLDTFVQNAVGLSAEGYLNTLVQVENTIQMHILQYVVISVGNKQSFQSFTYKQLSNDTGVPLSVCKDTVDWLIENGLLLSQPTKRNSVNKVYDLTQFREKERKNG